MGGGGGGWGGGANYELTSLQTNHPRTTHPRIHPPSHPRTDPRPTRSFPSSPLVQVSILVRELESLYAPNYELAAFVRANPHFHDYVSDTHDASYVPCHSEPTHPSRCSRCPQTSPPRLQGCPLTCIPLSAASSAPPRSAFNELAAYIMKPHPIIANIQLTPDTIVQAIYPLSGNEGAIGLDMSDDQFGKAEVAKALAGEDLIFSGPFALAQVRLGIFSGPFARAERTCRGPPSGDGQGWGSG